MRNEHGIMRANVDEWVEEFNFWKRFVYCKDDDEVTSVFIDLIKIVLN
jgi:hypothetical protein